MAKRLSNQVTVELEGRRTTPTDRRRARRRYPKTRRRKTAEFSISSAEHQRLALEAFEALMPQITLKRKRSRLAWMIRRLNASLQVHGAA